MLIGWAATVAALGVSLQRARFMVMTVIMIWPERGLGLSAIRRAG